LTPLAADPHLVLCEAASLGQEMAETYTIEFFKLASGNTVGLVLEELLLPFDGRAEFVEWAKKALPSRRGDDRIWQWPEAVRACTLKGVEAFRWTLWDQLQAGEVVAHAHRT